MIGSKVQVLDKGHVILKAHLGTDKDIAECARVSYDKGTKTKRDDADLIDYLRRHDHTSPFEMVVFRFEIKAPLFVIAQWMRHRTAKHVSVNQISGRYSEMPDEFLLMAPDELRGQSTNNKQGSQGRLPEGDAGYISQEWTHTLESLYTLYQETLERGVAREQARIHLPSSLYTSMIWQIDLHNLMHFLALRMDEHAQKEIRDYADAIYKLIEPIVPDALSSFKNHVLDAVKFSGDEMSIILDFLNTDLLDECVNKRELSKYAWLSKSRKREFLEKLSVSQ